MQQFVIGVLTNTIGGVLSGLILTSLLNNEIIKKNIFCTSRLGYNLTN